MATAVRFLRRTLRASQLLADGEIIPGITSDEYISRRKRLLEVLPEKSLAIIASADQQMMTDVVPYPFRQNGDYLYITGCTQPGGVAVLSEETGFCMFMPDTSKEDVVWQGQTAGVEAAVDFFKADKAFPLSQMQKEELYSLILETNKECIKLCKPGASINEIHNHSVKMLINGFQELGILEKGKSIQYNYLNPTAIGSLSICLFIRFGLQCKGLSSGSGDQLNPLSRWFPGHSLGLDIHDSVTLSKDKPLEPGVIITIEPGIYISPVTP